MSHPMKRLDPKLDLVFKLMLIRGPSLLTNMLEGVLARPIQGLTVLNPEIPGELANDKKITLDIRVLLADGSRVDIEMQIRAHPELASRMVYYAARDYAAQLGRGDDYRSLTPTVVVMWLLQPLFVQFPRLHSIFELRERHSHELFGDQLVIHLLQLRLSSPQNPEEYDAIVGRWARFLTARSEAQFSQLASEDPIMATAKEILDQLSEDPVTRRLARERSDAIKLYEIDLAASKTEGKAEVLLKLLTLRFGGLSDATRAQVEAASAEQLDSWIERVLTAETLDQVFVR